MSTCNIKFDGEDCEVDYHFDAEDLIIDEMIGEDGYVFFSAGRYFSKIIQIITYAAVHHAAFGCNGWRIVNDFFKYFIGDIWTCI